MATQTESQRKAAAQKAAATRRANAARRSRSAKKAAETRARQQLNLLQSAGLQAGRAGDVAIGAALHARDGVVDTARRLNDPRAEWPRLRGRVDTSARRFERRGAQVRKRTQRRVEQTVRRTRRDVERQVSDAQQGVERAVEEVRSTGAGLAGKAPIS